jgi:hypothetical protein
MTVNMTLKWLALSALTVVLAVSAGPAHARNAGGDTGVSAQARADQDFSAAKKYAKKQTDTYNQTKKYR